ncbi:hypothetical protein P0F65_11855 [Sphingomonas sp. I4]
MIATASLLHPSHHATAQPKSPYRIRRPVDRGERLARILSGDAMRAGCPVVLEVEDVTPWSSATFAGVVVTLRLTARAARPCSPGWRNCRIATCRWGATS